MVRSDDLKGLAANRKCCSISVRSDGARSQPETLNWTCIAVLLAMLVSNVCLPLVTGFLAGSQRIDN